MKIEICWLRDAIEQRQNMNSFFNSTEDPAFDHSHNCNTLTRGEKKVINCPVYSDNGNIEVLVSGKDMAGREYREKLILKNKIKK